MCVACRDFENDFGIFIYVCALVSRKYLFALQMIGLKIRTSIITTIYHKTMRVSSVDLSHFSTGQVVNFMSTDTDRIVNFCPSFHQFWSLPFQIAVSLYLLYLQVRNTIIYDFCELEVLLKIFKKQIQSIFCLCF